LEIVMPPPADTVYRALDCGDWRKLRGTSNLALRVYLELFWGDDSERAGVVLYRPAVVADTLGSSRRAVAKAVEELVAAGLVAADEDERVASRVGFIPRHLPGDRNNRVSWLNNMPQSRDSLIVAQAVGLIESMPLPTKRPTKRPTGGPACEPTGEPQEPQEPQEPFSPLEREPLSLTAPQQPAKKRRAKFVPPTEAEVKEVFVAKGMPEREAVHEATKFCGHHESKGWAKIVDWRAAAGKTWFTNWKKWNPQLDTTQRYYLEPASKLDEFGRVIA
jgi:hypothetical protein